MKHKNLINYSKLQKMRVLYIEDDVHTREELVEILRMYFQEVYEAKNGQEGLEVYETHRPDIVLTDISMPVMDGLEMAGKIKTDHPMTPILIMTAFNEVSYLTQALKIGIDHYVTKPINIDQLVTALYKATLFVLQRREEQEFGELVDFLCNLTEKMLFVADGCSITQASFGLLDHLECHTKGASAIEECLTQHLVEIDGIREWSDAASWIRHLHKSRENEHMIVIKNDSANEAEGTFVLQCHCFENINRYAYVLVKQHQ